MKVNGINGEMFSDMCVSAANALDNNKTAINNLNVFPVPDGDTGINMSLTMSTVRELTGFDGTISDCAARIADLILRSARGNSGAILSLFFRGFAKSLRGLEVADAEDIARAFDYGTKEAYSAVMNPAEGTILTVMRICAERAAEAAREKRFRGDAVGLFAFLLKTANDTLAKTPELLPILKETGVVDAGGSGFVTVISGMLSALNEHPVEREGGDEAAEEGSADFANFDTDSITFGYCTEFILDKNEAYTGEGKAAKFRTYLAQQGDSLVFIEDETFIKVHVHTNHPGRVLEECLTYGSLGKIKVENMRAQHSELLEKPKQAAPAPAPAPAAPMVHTDYGFVAVAVGEGVSAAFRDLGVQQVVVGGQTMNPSTDDILNAVNAVDADTVFIMPNNKNIFMVADRVAEMVTDKKVIVLPTTQFTQGISAMMAFDPTADVETNVSTMTEIIGTVTTVSVTCAVRDADVEGLHILNGQAMGLLNGKVKTVADEALDAIRQLLPQMESAGFLTVYYGEDAKEEDTAALEAMLREAAPDAELLVLAGGQPLYTYVISAE